MAHDIFISYSSKDKAIADAICAHMEARGLRCWYAPRDIQPGADWAESIIGGLNGARLMILIYTDFSNESDQVLREVAYAADRGIVIVPFRLSGIKPKERLGTYLKPTHWLDAINKELATSIQQLGNLCESTLRQISRKDERIAREASRSKSSRVLRIVAALVAVAVIAAVVAMVLAKRQGPQYKAPEDSALVSSIDTKDNGITRIILVDTLHCETPDMTCNGYAAAYAEYLNKVTGKSGYEVVQSQNGLGYNICRKGEKTGFDIVFLDGDNAMISGDKPFCLVGVTGKAEVGQKACLQYGAALIWTAYPQLRKAEAEELALILYSKDSPIHARNGAFELYCQVNEGYSLTILNSDQYND